VQLNALEVLKEAYELVRTVDALDASKEGLDVWAAVMEQYNDRVDRVETQMTTNLRNSLGEAKDAKDMFRSVCAVRCGVLRCVVVYCCLLQCVSVCCSVLLCVAVCCSVLQSAVV